MKGLVWSTLVCAAVLAGSADAAGRWAVSSPSGDVTITVKLTDMSDKADYPAGERLYYTVEWGPDYNRTAIIEDSPMGLVRDDQDFVDGLKFDSAGQERQIDETYTLMHGKRKECRNHANERTVTFANAQGHKVEVVLRAYDDGAAFRYRFPESDGRLHKVMGEATGFRLPEGSLCWMMPFDAPTQYTPAYEVYYQKNVPAGTTSPLRTGWAFPVLYHVRGGEYWALLTEAGLDENYFGARLDAEAANRVYRVRMPDPGEGNGTGTVEPTSTLPWETPWRVVITGRSLGTIVESTMVTNLADSSKVEDTGWIEPGRVSWSWCSDQVSPKDAEKLKKFIDLSAEMGWEYSLIDANWTIMDKGNIHDLLRYAKGKGVGLLLWYNSGGMHNYVTEKPRGTMDHPAVRKFEMNLLKEWGVKGIKVDFFQSDKQNVIRLYQEILRDAADAKIMINFHGCTLPRGWERTWPHLMTMEAVRGEECYIFDSRYPDEAPSMNTVYVFTRNVVGPMDYTPVAFSNNRYPHKTTWAHELALSVVFESSWLHFADSVESYRSLPKAPKEFLKNVPVTWDETRYVDGYPGKFAIVARRHGDEWYLAGINGEGKRMETEVDLSFLGEGKWNLDLIGDNGNGDGFRSSKMTVEAGEKVPVSMMLHGGFAARIYEKGWLW